MPLTGIKIPNIVNHMVNYSTGTLDLVFGALAHPIRRRILEDLSRGAATIKELAAPFQISLPGLMKHVGVLETAGLVKTNKHGRIRTCQLDAGPMLSAAEWLAYYEAFWNNQMDSLEAFLEQENEQQNP
jgi:DNA-binding transcriptional ArsR family regulator